MRSATKNKLNFPRKLSFHNSLVIISFLAGLLFPKMPILKENVLHMREESKDIAVWCGESGHFEKARLFPLRDAILLVSEDKSFCITLGYIYAKGNICIRN